MASFLASRRCLIERSSTKLLIRPDVINWMDSINGIDCLVAVAAAAPAAPAVSRRFPAAIALLSRRVLGYFFFEWFRRVFFVFSVCPCGRNCHPNLHTFASVDFILLLLLLLSPVEPFTVGQICQQRLLLPLLIQTSKCKLFLAGKRMPVTFGQFLSSDPSVSQRK